MQKLTRAVAILILVALVGAVVILQGFPDDTATLWAWTIRPRMTALVVGAGYAAGAWFFVRALRAKSFAEVRAGFPAIAAFTWAMAGATLLHLDRFSPVRPATIAWFALYAATPILIPYLGWRERGSAIGEPRRDDEVPEGLRRAALAAGIALAAGGLLMFAAPQTAIARWPWALTPLTARVLGGWFVVMGGSLAGLAREVARRAWVATVEAQLVGVALILASVPRAWDDLDHGPATWAFVAGLGALALALAWVRARVLATAA